MFDTEIDMVIRELKRESKRQKEKGNDDAVETLNDCRWDLVAARNFGSDERLFVSFCDAMCVLLCWRLFGEEKE